MCEFISWIEKDGAILYLTARDLKSSRGKRLRSRIGPDICGHGAIREFFDLAPGVGKECECTDFSTPDNFPPKIVADIKSGAFRGIGIATELLATPALAEYDKVRALARAEYDKVCDPARAEYDKVRDPARAEYDKVRASAWAEYDKVCALARAEYNKVCASAWAEYDKVCASARAEYDKVCASAWAEYDKVCASAWAEYVKLCASAFWKLFAEPANRPEAWR